MCTLVLAWQVFADAPVVAAANRDELLDRPADPPALLEEDPRVVAPRDREAGGTWLGYNEHGVFAAITNRWVDLEGDRSRGLLVREALRHRSAEDAARFVERSVEAEDYAGFNLVLADEVAAVYLEYDGALSVRNFQPGVHVVVNVGADGEFVIPPGRADAGERQAHDARRFGAALEPEPGESADDWLDRAADAVGDHEYGVCVHREGEGFGTRSSSLLALYDDGTSRFEFADGPPCSTEFAPVAALARPEEQL
ncbi:hypothetical protein BRC81_07940 [Halobacteriales archaeon QS_1_68_20]|nr:MAG: hypothetical protein BRC81_07940 [Halobacteriales archaeon QS_1_68_20]